MNARSFFVAGASCAPLVLLANFLAITTTSADEFVQRPPHEHGKVTINAALDGNRLVIELDSPAVNVVGFEHEPRTEAEHAAVQAAAALLMNGRGLFGMTREARCQFEKTELKAPDWEHGAGSEDEGDDHEHHEDEHYEHHADYHARLTYQCWSPDHLTWLQPTLLHQLRNVTEARVNIATATGQRSEVVENGHTHVALR